MRRLNQDDGGVAVIVALLAIVLFGFGALAVDGGALYSERRDLQNGADAGALAIAQAAAHDGITCSADLARRPDRAQSYLEGNSASSKAFNSGSGTAPSATATCPTDNKVTVAAEANASSVFAKILKPDYTGLVKAKATATWGSLGKYSGFPVTISLPEWEQAHSSWGFAPPGPYDPWPSPVLPDAGYERVIHLTGQDAPGSFGWLKNTDGVVTTQAGDYALTADTGSGFKDDKAVSQMLPCLRGFQAVNNDYCHITSTAQPTVSYIPVYDDVRYTGAGTEYRIVGYAALVVTGYQLPGVSAASWLTGKELKDYIDPATGKKFGGAEKVLTVFYTNALVNDLPAGGGDYGVVTPPTLVE